MLTRSVEESGRLGFYLHIPPAEDQSLAGEYEEFLSNARERLIVFEARCYEVPE